MVMAEMAGVFKNWCVFWLMALTAPWAWCAPEAVFAALRQAGISPQSVALMAKPVSEATSEPLFEFNQEQPFTLASTTKIATSLAALDLLGADFRWRTRAYIGAPISQGVLRGDLLLVGGGDARLSSSDLVAWFKAIQRKGLHAIEGHILINHGAFQMRPADDRGTPVPTASHPHHVRPDAFVVDEGVITVEVTPGPSGLKVSYGPRMEGVKISHSIRGARGQCGTPAESLKAVFDESTEPPRLRVSGQWSPACGPARLVVGSVPGSRFTPLAVAAAWRDAGGELVGDVVQVPASEAQALLPRFAKPFAVQESPSLPEVVVDMNKWSNNLIARNLMLSLSPDFPASPATLPGARRRMSGWLAQQGLSKDDMVVGNGSGLAHEERGRARAMVSLLCQAWRGPNAAAFLESLPVAGEDGTMGARLRGPVSQGRRAYLKTGTLSDTRALAGYVQGRSGRMYAVAAFINDPKAGKGRRALDLFIEWVMDQG